MRHLSLPSHLHMVPGQRVQYSVRTRHSAGLMWNATCSSGAVRVELVLPVAAIVSDAEKQDLMNLPIGSEGELEVLIEALTPGPAVVTLVESRPWLTEDPLSEVVTLTVIVEDAPEVQAQAA